MEENVEIRSGILLLILQSYLGPQPGLTGKHLYKVLIKSWLYAN
jgi:hypothetical protein